MGAPRQITVTGTARDGAGQPVAGAVLRFTTSAVLREAATDDVIMPGPVVARSGADGELLAVLAATDDPGFTPDGWTWLMVLEVPGRAPQRYAVTIPYSTPVQVGGPLGGQRVLKLSSLIPAQPSAGMTLYATLAALNSLAAEVAELEGGGGSGVTPEELEAALAPYITTAAVNTLLTGYATTAQLAAFIDPTELTAALSGYATTAALATYIDPAELATALAGYATSSALAAYIDPAELTAALAPYITSAAAAGYVDPTELAAALASYITTTAAAAAFVEAVGDSTITGSLTIAGTGKNYRLKTSGGDLDFDAAGKALFLSVYPNADYSGTQRTYLRLEEGAQLAHAIGRWVFAPTAFSGDFTIDADPATGVAKIGAANKGTGNVDTLPLAARWKALGAPTAGTWRVGDLVLADDGVWECVTAGTPGVWKPVETAAPWRPSDSNMSAWTFDPSALQGGTVLTTSGVSYVFRMRASTASIANILIHITTGGSGLTAGQCYATLHNAAGVQIGATADQATNWASGGLKVMALAGGPVAVVPGAWLTVRLWFVGTTGPILSRGGNSSSAIINAGLSAPNLRFASADTGMTTLAAAPATIGAQSGIPTAWWVAVS